MLQGVVTAGPMLAGNGLQVTIYKADGTVLQTATVNVDGTFRVSLPSDYTGPVLVMVTDTTTTADYMDEGTIAPKDLQIDLRAATVIPAPGTYNVNLNILTELAVRQLGLAGGDGGTAGNSLGSLTSNQIQQANSLVAQSFGLIEDLVAGAQPVAVIDTQGAPNTSANDYGRVLAAVSGAEMTSSTEGVLSTLNSQLSSTGLSATGLEVLVGGAGNVNVVSNLIDRISELTNKRNNEVRINTVAGDNDIALGELSQSVTISGIAAANHSLTISWGGTSYTVTADAQGNWSQAFSYTEIPASGGSSVVVTDTSTAAVATRAVYIEAPGAPIITLANDTANSGDRVTHDGTLNISGLMSGADWDYSLDGGYTWNIGTGNTLSMSGDGARNVRVRQISGGRTSIVGNALNFTLDTSADMLTTRFESDTGRSARDGITRTGTMLVDNIETDATWDYSTDGGTSWHTGSGHAFTLSAGTYSAGSVALRQTDAAGNSSLSSNTSAIVIDASAPTGAAMALAVDTGSSDSDDVTTNGVVRVSGIEVGANWQYSVDGGSTWSEGSGTSFFLSQGSWDVKVRQLDAAGNQQTTTARQIVVDISAPVSLGMTVAGSSVSISAIEAGASWRYSLDGGQIWSEAQSANVTSFTLPDGSYAIGDIKVRQTDRAGNIGSSVANTGVISIDSVAPDAPTLVLATDAGLSSSDGITNIGTVNVGGIEAGASWQYSSNGGNTWSTAQASSVTSFTLPAGSYASSTSIQVRQTDDAGNVSLAGALGGITVDTSLPSVPAFSLAADSGSSASDHITSNGTVSVSGIEAGAIWQYSSDGGSNWSTAQAASVTSFSLADGVFSSVKVRQTDVAGNQQTSVGQAITVDASAPAAPTLALHTDSGVGGDGISNVGTLDVSGIEVGAAWQTSLDGGATWSAAQPSSVSTIALANGSSSSVLVKQTDVAGNVSIVSQPLNVSIDSSAPTLVAMTPADGTNHSPAADLSFTMSENVVKGSGNIRIVNESANTNSTVTIAVSSSEVTVDGNRVTINPSVDLILNSNYHIEIDATAFIDVAGNAFAGISDSTAWNFRIPDPAIGLNSIAIDNLVNSNENATPLSISGTLSSSAGAAMVADFSASDFTVSLVPTSGASVAVNGITYDTNTGAWSGIAASTLIDGTYEVRVAVQGHGVQSNGLSGTVTGKLVVDTAAPSTPTMTLAKDSGSSTSDNITQFGTVDVSGLEAGATWQYSTDGGSNWSTAQAASITSFTLAAGNHTSVQVRQTDAAGNQSSASTAVNITIDTAADAAPTFALAYDNGASSDGISNDGTMNVSGVSNGATWQYSTNGGQTWSAAQDSSVTNFTLATGSYGQGAVLLRQTDVAGNISTSAANSAAIIIDVSAPITTAFALLNDTAAADRITSDGSVKVSGIEGDATWQYSTDDGANWSAAQASSVTNFSLADGVYTSIKVRQTDAAGNQQTTVSQAITVDSSAPAAPVFSLAHDLGSSNSDLLSNDGRITVSGIETGATWQYSTDGGFTWSSTLASSITTFSLPEGRYAAREVQVRQTDVAGNFGEPVSNTNLIRIDTTAPSVLRIVLATDTGSSASDGITKDGSMSVSGIEAGATWEYSVDGGDTWSAQQAASVTSFTLSDGGYVQGDIQVRQTDMAGNISSETSSTNTMRIDTTVPNNLSLALVTDTGSADGITSVGTMNVSRLETGATWQYSTDHGNTWSLAHSSSVSSFTLPSGSFASGDIVVRQIDVAGNIGPNTANLSPITYDTAAPAAISLVLNADSGISTSDGVTNVASFTVSGVEVGANWQYSLDAGSSWSSAQPQSTTAFTVTTTGISDVLVRQTDVSGQHSLLSDPMRLNLIQTPLTIASTSPVDGGLIAPGDDITFTMSSDVFKGTGYIHIVDDTNNGNTIIIDVNDPAVSIEGAFVRINPSADLHMTEAYHIKIDAGSLIDRAGNAFAGISDTTTWNFSVPDPAVSIDPISNDNLISAAEYTGTMTLSGTLSSMAGNVVAGFSTSDFTGSVSYAGSHATTNAVATITAFDASTGIWTGEIIGTLSEARYEVVVSATHGGLSATSTSIIDLDLTGPRTPTVTLAEDTGRPDGITKLGVFNVGNLEAGTTWQYSTDSGSTWSSVQPASITTFELQAGQYQGVVVRQTDYAGNQSAVSGVIPITIDATAPDAPGLVLVNDSGLRDNDSVTTSGSATIEGLEDNGTWQVSFDGGVSWSVAQANGNNTLTLPEGNWSALKLRQFDLAGNVSQITPYSIRVDNTAPLAPDVVLTASTTDGGAIVAPTNTENGARAEYRVKLGSNGFSNWNTAYSAPSAEGSYVLEVRQTDVAGNVSPTQQVAFTIAGTGSSVAPAPVQLSAIRAGSGGFVINGACSADYSGFAVSDAGDVNGDGLADVIVSTTSYDPSGRQDAGGAFVVFGKTNGMAVELSAVLAGSGGFAINGRCAGDLTGTSISAAGDVNGDGLADIIVGAPGSFPSGFMARDKAGTAYVVFGKTGTSNVELSTVANGTGGFAINGQAGLDYVGISVASAGDMNGDGLADLVVGATGAEAAGGPVNAGRDYVVYGKSSGTAVELSVVASGSGGFAINGISSGDETGFSVANAGDVNGDGLTDLVLGADLANPNGLVDAGRAYVVFGRTGSTAISLSAVAAGNGGFVMNGICASANAGWSVDGVGDVNGDGLADVIVSEPSNGISYVVFGTTGTSAINLSAVANGKGGFAINGDANGFAGASVSGVGDINGDGLADLLIGSSFSSPDNKSGAGSSYVVYGKTSTTAVELSGISAGSTGFVINGECTNDNSGYSVSAAGDVNGDGLADLIVSAFNADIGVKANAGRSYVIFGSTDGAFASTAVDVMGNVSANNLSDGGVAKTLVGGAGFDTLTATAASVLLGGSGGDTFHINGAMIAALSAPLGSGGNVGVLARVDGGGSTDGVMLDGAGLNFNLTKVVGQGGNTDTGFSRLSSIEAIDINGIGANVLTLRPEDISSMSGMNLFNIWTGWNDLGTSINKHQLQIKAGADDTVNLVGAWTIRTQDANVGGNQYYKVVEANGVQALISREATIHIVDPNAVAAAPLQLSSIGSGTGGFIINGESPNDQAGLVVSNAGDVNGDGLEDLLVHAPNVDIGLVSDAGRAYVVFGKTGTTVIQLSAVVAGSGGFVINGISADDKTGYGISTAGDLNGDGLADVLVGVPQADGSAQDMGRAYVVYGKTNTTAVNLSALAQLGSSNGFMIGGLNLSDSLGASVSAAGDVNGDGMDDFIVGAPFVDNGVDPYSGASYVVFGKTGMTSVKLSAIAAGNGGFVINGQTTSEGSGYSVSNAGDVNGDGLSDLIVGAPFGMGMSGRSYVVFGKAGGAAVNLSAIEAGSGGFVVNGEFYGDMSGLKVAGAGDVNGDGLTDVVIGASSFTEDGIGSAGRSYVVFGKTDTNGVALADVAAGGAGFAMFAESGRSMAGVSVASAGDFNGDGLADLIIGAPGALNEAGRTYVVYGRTGTTSVDLSAIAAGVGGFAIDGRSSGDGSGFGVSAAGDVNGDGLADLIVGAPKDANSAGAAYVIFGATGGAVTGSSVDLLGVGNTAEEWSDGGVAKTMVGGAGNDSIGAAAASVMIGGSGNDTLAITNSAMITALQSPYGAGGNVGQLARIDGGTGSDTLALSGSGMTLDLGLIDNLANRISGIETISLTGTGNNILTLSAADVRAMTEMNNVTWTELSSGVGLHRLVVDGNAGVVLNASGKWDDKGMVTHGGQTYRVYQQDGVQLIVDTDMTRNVATSPSYAPLQLSAITIGSGGFVINGACMGDQSGSAIASAGDVNGDGLDDIIVGALMATISNSQDGASYVVFGTSNNASINLSAVAVGIGGFVIGGEYRIDYSGRAVSAAGDVNGDGLADLFVGATGADNRPMEWMDVGAGYVVFGKTSGSPVNLSAIAAGSGGFKIFGESSTDQMGQSVSGVGDVNGDGYADLLIASSKADTVIGGTAYSDGGRSYVVFGKSTTSTLALSSVARGSGGFVVFGDSTLMSSGTSIAGAGDVNGDGYADVIVGTPGIGTDPAHYNSGAAYVVYGKSGTAALNLFSFSGAGNASAGFAIWGATPGGRIGNSVAGLGDVNGDGLADLAVSGSFLDSSYVVFGNSTGAAVNLSALGSNGFVIPKTNMAEANIVGVGDINGDGLSDMLLTNAADVAYVVYGTSSTNNVSLTDVAAGVGGFSINVSSTNTTAHKKISAGGDINGDGLADLLISDYNIAANSANNSGRTYVIFGATDGAFTRTAVDVVGTTADESFNDNGVALSFAAGDGNDTLTATAASVLRGGAGDDNFIVGGGMLTALQAPLGNGGNIGQLAIIDGGNGMDTLNLSGSAQTLTLARLTSAETGTGISAARLSDIERIDLTGSGNNTVVLTAADVRELGSRNAFNSGNGWVGLDASVSLNQLVIDGDAGDVLSGSGTWRDMGTATHTAQNQTQSYHVYQTSGAQLLVNTVLTVAGMTILPDYQPVELSAIAGGAGGGFVINGNVQFEYSGHSVSGIGDFNGDGLDDVLIGTNLINSMSPGRSYVVFGRTNQSPVDLSSLSLGSGGFFIPGIYDATGTAASQTVSGAGDVNGDGLADLIVSAQTNGAAGRAFVVFGRADTTLLNVSLGNLVAGCIGFVINGQCTNDNLNRVSSAGDVNGDGYADLLVSLSSSDANGINAAGLSYVVFGKADGNSVMLSAVANGIGGFLMAGGLPNEHSGTSISSAGDVNGDGLADMLVTSMLFPSANSPTRDYVVFGKSDSSAINLTTIMQGSGGFAIDVGIFSGYATVIADAGDVNGDGLADMVIGNPNASVGAVSPGRAYVVFGKSDSIGINLSNVVAGTGGFVMNGVSAADMTGWSVSSAGDVNGDGLADLLVSAHRVDSVTKQDVGAAYVVYGKSDGTAVNLSAVAAGSGGFVITGNTNLASGVVSGEQLGFSVSTAGDINGDGLADLIVSSPTYSQGGVAISGRSYVIFGGTRGAFASTAVDLVGGSGSDSLADGGLAKTLVGGAGDDSFTATAASVLFGGAGNDSFSINGVVITALQSSLGAGGNNGQLARIVGGNGIDTISLSGTGLTFDLRQVANQAAGDLEGGSRISSIEKINLTGSGNNTLILSSADVRDMAGMNAYNDGNGWTGLGATVRKHQLVIDGNAGDSLQLTDFGGYLKTITVGGQSYAVYQGAGSQVLVDTDINVTGSSPQIALSSIAAGGGGFVINGQCAGDASGYSVSSAGDVNGDGLADLIIGARLSDVGLLDSAGRAYVVYGRINGGAIDLSAVAAGTGGFVINGQSASYQTGFSVSGAGDVNGDGFADLIVGAPENGTGRAYVVYGKSGTGIAALNLSSLASTSLCQGFVINGQCVNDMTGFSVSSAGDVNGDGLADLLVSAKFADTATIADLGRTYVVFGKSTSTAVNLSALQVSQSAGIGFVITGQCGADNSGYSVSSAGDVNGDDLADFIIGANTASVNGQAYAGRSYVVFGKTSTTPINLSALAASTPSFGFVINGESSGDHSGRSVSNAGDVNGDGYADLLIGANLADPLGRTNSGRSYVVFGKATNTSIDLSAVAVGNGGFAINGGTDQLGTGCSLSSAGDINGDGLTDVIVGAQDPSGNSHVVDQTYVVFGKSSGTAVDLQAVSAGSGGFVLLGQSVGDHSGSSVSAAGDVNGDGLADLLIGAPDNDAFGVNAGRSYVVYGSTSGVFMPNTSVEMGGTGNNILSDDGTAKLVMGGIGNDTLTATAASVLSGGAGDDTFVIDSVMRDALQGSYGSAGNTSMLTRIDGGTGLDTIRLTGTGLTFDLTQIEQSAMTPDATPRLNSIEILDLTATGMQTVKLTAKDVMDMSSAIDLVPTSLDYRRNLIVNGTASDVLDLSDGGANSGTTGWSLANFFGFATTVAYQGNTYEIWYVNQNRPGQVSVLVQQGMSVI